MSDIKRIHFFDDGKLDPDDINGLYIIKSNSYFFLVHVTSYSEDYGTVFYSISVTVTPRDDDDTSILNSTFQKHCLTIEVEDRNDSRSGHIDLLSHNNICSLCKDLEKKTGTYEMVMSSLYLCYKLFGVTRFTLQDASTFLCSPIQDHINLRNRNLLVHGKSWYEEMFGAVPKSSNDLELWSDAQSRLRGNIEEKQLDYLVYLVKTHVPSDMQKRFVYTINRYKNETSSSWNKFFKDMSDLEYGCVFFSYPILTKISGKDRLNIPDVKEWVINVNEDQIGEHLLHYKKIYP